MMSDMAQFAHIDGSDTIRIGLVGCGNRGTGACREALLTEGPIQLVALADLFPEQVERALLNLTKYDELRSKIDVSRTRQFAGFDACERLLATSVDLVLLATPPHFRPAQYAAAIEAGKHIFMEKPCCIDAPGYRMLVAANEVARTGKLTVVVGLQRRHQRNYLEGIEQIHSGAIGDVQLIRTYFNVSGGGRAGWMRPRGMPELEYQIRHWGVFSWLCGDHLVEQATHAIDVANWIMNDHPMRAQGMGGRQARFGPGNGDIWDHHCVEFEYAGGQRHFCQSRQQRGSWTHVSEIAHGTRGMMTLGTGAWGLGALNPRDLRKREYRNENPYQREHDDLVASIRGTGPYRFEGDYGATSSMTAVMGRMATYSGQLVSWEDAVRSDLRLAPDRYAWDAEPPVRPLPDGGYDAALPGITRAF